MTNGTGTPADPVQLPQIKVITAPTQPDPNQGGATEIPPGSNLLVPTRPDDAQGPLDQATLIVAGINFQDWESVWVQIPATEQFSFFRFTSVERQTQVGLYPQFMPGEPVIIKLGGATVCNGFIETRQVAYDATKHGIELIGKSFTEPYSRSSVYTETGNFDGMTFEQVMRKVLSFFPVGMKVIGALDATPFAQLQNQPGERVWDFLERIARPRGIVLGSDPFGNFLAIGDHNFPVINTALLEGQNIKKCQYSLTMQHLYQEAQVVAQAPASDGNSGTAASQLKGTWGGSGIPGTINITPADQPVKTVAEVIARAKNESKWLEGTKLNITIIVQGWYRDPNTLWWPLQKVRIASPMLPFDDVLKIHTVTFTQDNQGGTQTQLDFVYPWAINDQEANVAPMPSAPAPGSSPQPVP
jgi:prophage tail gpP-like protein